MCTVDKIKINKFNIINLLLALIPFSIILGNLAININVVIICIFGLIIFKKEIFFLEQKKYQYLLYIFFSYLIFTTLINYAPNINLDDLYKRNIFKSFFYLRFLIFFLVINKLIETENINIRLFIISSSFFSLILSIDILIQITFGKDIFGLPMKSGRASGFFGDELIAGGYLQKFILFLIFGLVAKFYNNKKRDLITFSLFFIFLIPIFFSGNRMPFVIYIFSLITYFLLNKNYKSILTLSLSVLIFIFINLKFPIINNGDSQIKNFAKEIFVITKHAPKLFINENYSSDEINFRTGYLVHFNTGVQIWKKNKIIGNGIKSMPLNCTYKNFQTCNSHPHNYFIEILMDIGIIGLILIYSIFSLSIYNYIKYFFSNHFTKNNIILFPIFGIIFFEFFPLRSSGSFFTTNNATIIFLMLALMCNYKKIIKKI